MYKKHGFLHSSVGWYTGKSLLYIQNLNIGRSVEIHHLLLSIYHHHFILYNITNMTKHRKITI